MTSRRDAATRALALGGAAEPHVDAGSDELADQALQLVDLDIAMRLLEPVAALMQALPADQQRDLAALITTCAEEETDPDRRMTALDLPYAIGIS
ncbi:hypothetical protein [Actinomadura latina]|uniref:Uncharacterized protein n=1 Tax=Actinomadura latina TaxID=163603 RepID=A0A846Z3I0_9ACTN|nr:hypothetical protein [Actinomadura latina]NKZ07900.1 hypothetical protein [Actinomadura latina]